MVHMSEARAAIPLTRPLSKALYNYWNALRNGRPVPYRREIDPARLSALLPHLFILEQNGTGPTIFRLAGTAICTAFGRELRDHAFISLWREKDRSILTPATSAVLSEAGAAVLGFEAVAIERPRVSGEITLLPLLDEAGRATRIIGSLDTTHRVSTKPFVRLELTSIVGIAPATDRVTLPAQTPVPVRHALTLVQSGKEQEKPSLTRPWTRLVQSLWDAEEPLS
jgi:hypothetical protein